MRRVSAFLRRHLPMMLALLALLVFGVVVWIFSAPITSWLRSAQSFDAAAFLGEHLLAVAMFGGCLLVLALIWLPKWQAARSDLTTKERLELEIEARKGLAEIVGGTALLVGLYFTWANLQVTQETATKDRETTREGQITERFTKAIDQLGHEKLQIRLGGIYALERIARESPQDHWPIMEVLTAYVRETAPRPPEPPKDTQPSPKPATDIQAILTVLGRRTQTYENGERQPLNLSHTDLRGADLYRAQLQGADLWGAWLQGAILQDAQLQGAILEEAQLQGAGLWGADLYGARLQGADLREAELQLADLREAELQLADLRGADLGGAQLQGADLREAQLQGAGLWGAELSKVKTLSGAHLDPYLLRQIQQQYPGLLSKRPSLPKASRGRRGRGQAIGDLR